MVLHQDDKKNEIRERFKCINQEKLYVIPAKQKSEAKVEPRILKVAVYARVSTIKDVQFISFELQKQHYVEMVEANPDWQLVDVYGDDGVSGTSIDKRNEFQRLLNDCRLGKIDLVITKSVARFSRNILDCISVVRELAALPKPIDIYFESEGIHSLDKNAELMLSVLAAVAQEEAHNRSLAMNASIEQRFSKGIFILTNILGYRRNKEGSYTIYEPEADIVRLCFYLRLVGYSTQRIADILTLNKIETPRGLHHWSNGRIRKIITNEKYYGDYLAHKVFTPDYLDHRQKENKQKKNKYLLHGHHPAIISKRVFDAVGFLLHKCVRAVELNYIPAIRVGRYGLLRGYVTIDLNFRGYTYEEYRKVSLGCYTEDENDTPGVALPAISSINLCNRNNLLGFMLFEDRIMFNKACYNSFGKYEEIEILLNFHTRKLIIRPPVADSEIKEKWSCKGKLNIWSGYFTKFLYKLLGADKTEEYFVPGELLRNNGQEIIIFDLTQAKPSHYGKGDLCFLNYHCYGNISEEVIKSSDFYARNEVVTGSSPMTYEDLIFARSEIERILKERNMRLE